MYYNAHTHRPCEAADTIYICNLRYAAGIATPASQLYSVGIHPWDTDCCAIDDSFLPLAQKAVAIGECGLDKACHTDYEHQKDLFAAQINLTNQLQKPLIVHCVRSYGDLLKMSRQYSPHTPWIVHSCSASAEWIRESRGHDFYYSYSLRNLRLQRSRAALIATPRHRLLLETDEQPEPISEVYSAAAQLIGVDVEELKIVVNENFKRIIRF